MQFTLIHYTADWEAGPKISLPKVPEKGSLIWLSSSSKGDDENDMFYVDNMMYEEMGSDDDEGNVFLFVRPYTKYGESAPMGTAESMNGSAEELRKAVENVSRQIADMKTSIADAVVKAGDNADDSLKSIADIVSQGIDSMRDDITDLKDSVSRLEESNSSCNYLLEDIKANMQ